MEILHVIKNSSPEECREIGELILEMGTKPRTPQWHADIDTAIALHTGPKEKTLAERLEKAGNRMRALNDGLLADGMNHERLIADELLRRGDSRSLSEYLMEVCDGVSHSDVRPLAE